jgi:PAS domain S-box-containing protein
MDSLFQALAGAADGAFVIDEDQQIVYWNQAAQEMLGYTAEEALGRACYEILEGRDDWSQPVCRHHCYVVATAVTGSPVTTYDTYARTKFGQMRWINVSILTFPAPNGAGSLVVHLFRDATQKKQDEQFTRQVLDVARRLRQGGFSQAGFVPLVSPAPELTEREREVLSLLAQGLSTSDIATALSISLSTARNHVQNILHKLQVHSRVEAVAYAFEHGLVHKE